MTLRQRLNWFALHAVIRKLAAYGARHGDLQGRLIADPSVRADPGAFADELRSRGRMYRGRAAWITADHALVHQILRSDDFTVTQIGGTLPGALGWLEGKTTVKGRLHPLLPPSLLSVDGEQHTRYRKTVSAVFTTRAVAACCTRSRNAATGLIDDLTAGATVDVVQSYCSQLPVTVIADILGVPEHDRSRILEFGELAAPSLDIGLTWQQYLSVEDGLDGFNTWLSTHIRELRANPGDNLMSQLIEASDGEIAPFSIFEIMPGEIPAALPRSATDRSRSRRSRTPVPQARPKSTAENAEPARKVDRVMRRPQISMSHAAAA